MIVARRLVYTCVAVFLSAQLGACNDSEPQTQTTAATPKAPMAEGRTTTEVTPKNPATAAPVCDAAHGETLKREMLLLCETSRNVAPVDLPDTPWKAVGSAGRTKGRITLEPGALLFQNYSATPPELVALFKKRTAVPWTLAIAQNTPRAEVAGVLSALASAGKLQGAILLQKEAQVMPKPRDPAALAKQYASSDKDPTDPRNIFVQHLVKVPDCEGAERAFARSVVASSEERCGLLAAALSLELVDCQCKGEDLALTMLYAITLGETVPTHKTTVANVTLDPNAPPRAGATWGEVVAGLTESDLKNFWLAHDL